MALPGLPLREAGAFADEVAVQPLGEACTECIVRACFWNSLKISIQVCIRRGLGAIGKPPTERAAIHNTTRSFKRS